VVGKTFIPSDWQNWLSAKRKYEMCLAVRVGLEGRLPSAVIKSIDFCRPELWTITCQYVIYYLRINAGRRDNDGIRFRGRKKATY
jgi:hypothetical protein